MDHNDIWKEKSRLDRERGVKLREFLKDYDSRVYDPAMKKLRENCEKLGHKFSFHGYNLTASDKIYKCNYCGVTRHEQN